jgi:hypothetical protein
MLFQNKVGVCSAPPVPRKTSRGGSPTNEHLVECIPQGDIDVIAGMYGK